MDVTVHNNKLEIDLFTNADYKLKDGVVSFSRELVPTPSGSRYNSYSSMVDNMHYQPSWVKNAYELGSVISDTELISLGSSFYIFDRIPRGIKSVVYKNSGEKLIEVEFGTRDDGVVEYNFDQILLLKFEPDDTTSESKSTSTKIHEGINETEGVGHKFHRAYNAIQFQDSNSIASKLLITAIFDTFDIDFSKGTLIGADSSKYFIGNRVKGRNASVPLLYEKIVNKIYNLNGDIISLSEAEEKLSLTVGNIIELENAGEISGYYRVLSGPTLIKITDIEVPSVFPIYSNESTFCSSYIYGENSLSSKHCTFYYPPSSGALFEYSNGGCLTGCSMYYYINSPMIDSGFNGVGEASISGVTGFNEEGYTPVVGTHLTEEDEDHKISVHFFSRSLCTLDENESNWNYTKSGELIINNNQLSMTYPII